MNIAWFLAVNGANEEEEHEVDRQNFAYIRKFIYKKTFARC